MAKCVCVIAEFRAGNFRRVSFEVASEGRRLADALGTGLCAVAIGAGVSAKAADLGQYGVDKVYVAEDSSLEHYVAESYVPIATDVIGKCKPAVVVVPASVDGKDLAARDGMARASLYAGIGIGNAGTNIVHALAYPLQGQHRRRVLRQRGRRPRETHREPEGPLSPKLCRIGQQIVDSAVLSSRMKTTVKLVA